MPKSASISMLRRWIRENIAIPKQAPPSAYWQLGKRVADVRARHDASWRDLAERLGIGDATLRQAMNFATRFKKKEAAALDRAGAGWRAVLSLVGRKDEEERRQLFAEMPGLMARAKQRGVPQLDIVKEFIAENFGQEADPKTPARLPDVLAKMQKAADRIVPLFHAMAPSIEFLFKARNWHNVTTTRRVLALTETLDEASYLMREAYVTLYKKMSPNAARKRIAQRGEWFAEQLLEDSEWVERRFVAQFYGEPPDWAERRAEQLGFSTVAEFRQAQATVREARKYFLTATEEEADVATMLSSDSKVGTRPHAAAWTIAEPESCCKPRLDGTTIASDFCKKICYGGPNLDGRLYRGRSLLPAKAQRNAKLRRRSDFVKLMTGCLDHEQVRLLRLHMNGDFDTPEYIEAWLNIISNYPWAEFLVFTRAWRAPELVPYVEKLAALPNAYVHLSYDKSAHNTPTIPNAWTAPLLDSRDNPPPLKPQTDSVAFRVRQPDTHVRYKRKFADEAKKITRVCPRESGYFKCDDDGQKKSRKPKRPDNRKTARTCYYCGICL